MASRFRRVKTGWPRPRRSTATRCASAWRSATSPSARALKAIMMDRTLPVEDRFNATMKLAQLPRNGAAVRVRLRCELTGRSRGNYRKFKLCRIALRDLANAGADPRHGQGELVREGRARCQCPIPWAICSHASAMRSARVTDVHGAGLEAARQRARRAEARGLHPRLHGRGAAPRRGAACASS